MTTEERSPERILGYLEASVEDLKTGQQEIREDMRDMRGEIRALREEMQAGFARVNDQFAQVYSQFVQVNSEIRRLYIAALGIGGGIVGSLIAVIATLVVLILKIN